MALLDILEYPDPRLRIKGKSVTQFDEALCTIVNNMYETMYAQNGIGLAAIQVNIPFRIFIMDLSESRDQPVAFINPEIISRVGTQYEAEACLSVGGNAYDKVKRAETVKVRARNVRGETFEMEADGLKAACIQHEMDHLEGILFIDHLSRLKQDRIRKKIEKFRSNAQ